MELVNQEMVALKVLVIPQNGATVTADALRNARERQSMVCMGMEMEQLQEIAISQASCVLPMESA